MPYELRVEELAAQSVLALPERELLEPLTIVAPLQIAAAANLADITTGDVGGMWSSLRPTLWRRTKTLRPTWVSLGYKGFCLSNAVCVLPHQTRISRKQGTHGVGTPARAAL